MSRIGKLLFSMTVLGGVVMAGSVAHAIPNPPERIGVHSAPKHWVQYWCSRYPVPGQFFKTSRSLGHYGSKVYKFGCRGFKITRYGQSMILGCWKNSPPNNCELKRWPPIKVGPAVRKPLSQM